MLVDAVTSLGGMPVDVAAWGIDACYSGSQKCLGAPSGIAPLVFTPRAWARRVACRSFYFDLGLLDAYWRERKYHHTIAATLVYALAEALAEIEDEGLEQRWERHRRHHELHSSQPWPVLASGCCRPSPSSCGRCTQSSFLKGWTKRRSDETSGSSTTSRSAQGSVRWRDACGASASWVRARHRRRLRRSPAPWQRCSSGDAAFVNSQPPTSNSQHDVRSSAEHSCANALPHRAPDSHYSFKPSCLRVKPFYNDSPCDVCSDGASRPRRSASRSSRIIYLTLPDIRSLASENPETTAFIELRASQAHAEGEIAKRDQRWVSYEQISQNLKRAVLVSEDSAFWQHDGVDMEQLKASIEKDLERGQMVRGGSTITQQLAKNLYLSPSRNPIRKLRELIISRRLEAALTQAAHPRAVPERRRVG